MHGFSQLFLCLVISITTPVFCASAETQAEMTVDACSELDKSNSEMNEIYRRILKDNMDEKRFAVAFERAQMAWSVFRDAHLLALYPQAPDSYGTAHEMCRCLVLNQMTRERIETLKKWLSSNTEGDLCSGSMMKKER